MRAHNARPASDVVKRDFTPSVPDQLWIAGTIYIPTWAGFLYLVVMFRCLESAGGWMANHLRAELVF